MGNFFAGVRGQYSEESAEDLNDVPLQASRGIRSKDELNRFITDEIRRAGQNIGHELEHYLDRSERENQRLRGERNYYRTACTELGQRLEKLRNEKVSLERRLQDCLKVLQEKDEEILKLKQLTDPTQEMRLKGHGVRPGDVMHDDVAKEFKRIYSLRSTGANPNDRAKCVTKVMEVAYNVCKKSVLEKATVELEKLFDPPSSNACIDERRNEQQEWKLRQEALSVLISSNKPTFIPADLQAKIEAKTDDERGIAIIGDITALTWNMVTVSPPISFGFIKSEMDDIQFDEMYDQTNTDGVSEDDIRKGNCLTEFRRPILYFGPLGVIGCKGSVALYNFNKPLMYN